ncbi:uncharacterized protein RSE6_14512 [Rhynchosporium secalis]|uniref:Uncharacterized protein n=1 Tax=Rhynchosporium secalis TaxID=38038 RepID=A0A1E1MVG8_RHYSE|nr:uncharacterized protein RSE6_14512 [Rhynchosporium secalis]
MKAHWPKYPPSAETCKAIWILQTLPTELRDMIFKHDIESHILEKMTPASPLLTALREQVQLPECTDIQNDMHTHAEATWFLDNYSVSSLEEARELCTSLKDAQQTSSHKYLVIRGLTEKEVHCPSIASLGILRPHTICLNTSDFGYPVLHWGPTGGPAGSLLRRIVPSAFAGGQLEQIVFRRMVRMDECKLAVDMLKKGMDGYLGR